MNDNDCRLAQFACCECPNECLVMALVYLERLFKLHPEFALTPLNIHKVTATAITIAAKYHEDHRRTQSFYASVCGISAAELSTLEAIFLQLLEWKMYVSKSEFEEYLVLSKQRFTRPSGRAPMRPASRD